MGHGMGMGTYVDMQKGGKETKGRKEGMPFLVCFLPVWAALYLPVSTVVESASLPLPCWLLAEHVAAARGCGQYEGRWG